MNPVFRWLLGCNPSEHAVASVSPEEEEFSPLYFLIWIPVHLPDSEMVGGVVCFGHLLSCIVLGAWCSSHWLKASPE